jgi:streptomycin 6-kinase
MTAGVGWFGVRDIPVVHIEEVRARLARRFGPAVADWCAELPALLDAVAGQWQLRLGQAWSAGGTSVVLPCWADGGGQLVLKLTPELQIAADEAAALQGWAASPHVVMLHDADLERGALLLERVQPGTRLADEPDPWPLQDVAPMLSDLQQPVVLPIGSGLPDLRHRVEFVFELTRDRLRRYPATAERVPSGLVEDSRLAARALADDGPVRLVHGDLHPGNVLRGGPGRSVVAIDPRPCLGDPAFDAVDWVLASGGGETAVRNRIDRLAGYLDEVDTDRVWSWCKGLAVVVAVSLLGRRADDQVGRELLGIAAG